ncbi:ABC-type antimicrobial peptide transport system permease subunit [Dyadobacter sp. BE34]|uniref:ABC-type antimicrobial peptide transport system permease subunit n=1 Tax=Dyadobacter fermentans TaxID=94254 RepID=A0ABU1R035_9BACT|nr:MULTISPECIES: ABC transporter permease [Dyadobacter]MDR6806772.1 ABC-type antimicrobial peptide transport system permease subunit [Dyadobacter fermentans]MDR7044514.1 ABC-type antimicrobial peptide transport system permease subunit [Dyadobacter sp. BE242]MDR7198824.1 ABC-type antimicrobial peptide transport system permease subunit [Dyadobacter sp. BE34]MDR7216786.1 ABC-type antimicrobial peptide transport system permease subunit [Dyadobacter sp. BE31]MDR7263688.1 ABC-type antimicrobial pept
MVKSYFKIAFRNFQQNKVYSLINVSGLALALTVTILISLWVWDELNYNKGIKNHRHVGRVMAHVSQNGEVASSPNLPFPLAAELRENFAADFEQVAVSWDTEDYSLTSNGNKYRKKGRFIEPDGAKILSPQMVSGSVAALSDPARILLSESAAASIFGSNQAIGQLLKIDNELDATVAGVYKDFPQNSDYSNLSFIAPWKLFASARRRQWVDKLKDNWNVSTFEILVQTRQNTTVEAASEKIKQVLNRHLANPAGSSSVISLHPMSKWHLYASWENGVNTGGHIYYVKLFSAIAAFVLLLACINFMNLSTARSEQRAKEIGVRKAVGSGRGQLIFQFIFESLTVVVVSFLIALLLVELVLPQFNAITYKQIGFISPGGAAFNPYFQLTGLAFCLLVSFVAGSYPALFLSSFKPVKVLKAGVAGVGKLSSRPRKVLVVLQFTISISLIIAAAGVFRQMQFGQDRSTGYDRKGLLYVKIPPGSPGLEALKTELLHSGIVSSVAQSSGPVTDVLSNAGGFTWQGKSPGHREEFSVIAASHQYGRTVGWQIVQGRDFSEAFISDSSAIIINQSAAKYMGLDHPIGQTVRWKDGTFNDSEYHIVGVIRDMVMQSPYEPVKQAIYFMTYAPNYLYIKLKTGGNTANAPSKLGALFDKHLPGHVFDFQFADQQYDLKFENEERIGKLTVLFAAIAIITSCLGLFGLAAFTAEQRRSEIGIRKVLGASVAGVWALIAKDFVYLTAIAAAVATPVSYYFLMKMLENYHYRSTIPWWIFGGSAALALLLSMLTVSYQAVKAALTDPAKVLRSE